MDKQAAQNELAALRHQLDEAEKVGNLTGEAMRLHLTQLVNSMHGVVLKAEQEIERLEREIASQRGRIRGAEQTTKLVIATLQAHNSTARRVETEGEEDPKPEEPPPPPVPPKGSGKKKGGRRKKDG